MIRSHDDLQHHEAAHAAMNMVLDIPLKRVSVVPGYGFAGYVQYTVRRGSPQDAAKAIMSTLAGPLMTTDWRERSGRLDPQRSSDEAHVMELIEAWNISEKTYNDLLAHTAGGGVEVEMGRVNTQARIITKATKPADDADRDPDGLISDEQVERDIQQLQRDSVEEQHVVVSMNGNGKSVHDDVYELMVKSLSGLHVEVQEFDCDE